MLTKKRGKLNCGQCICKRNEWLNQIGKYHHIQQVKIPQFDRLYQIQIKMLAVKFGAMWVNFYEVQFSLSFKKLVIQKGIFLKLLGIWKIYCSCTPIDSPYLR